MPEEFSESIDRLNAILDESAHDDETAVFDSSVVTALGWFNSS